MRIIFGKVITLINMSNEHHTASRWCVPFVTQWVFIILTGSKWYCYHFYHSSSALSPRPRQPRVITNQIRTWAAKGYGGMQHFLPTSSNRSHLAHSYVTFKFSGKLEACDKSTLWSWEMFDSFRWARCRGFSGGGVSLLWMPNEKHLPAVTEIHLSVDLPFPIKPASSRSGWEAVRGGKNRKTTTINEVLHWEITMCALPDSICTSLMACAIMWASINIKAGTVSAKGFTTVTAAPPLQMSREGIYMKYSGIVSQSHCINSCRGIRSNSGPCIEKLWKNKSDLNERPCWETSRGNILSFEFSNFWNLKKWRGSKEKRGRLEGRIDGLFHSFYLFIEDSEHVGFGQIIEAAPYWLRCYSFLSVVYMTVYVHVIKSFIDVIYYLSIYIYIYIYTICPNIVSIEAASSHAWYCLYFIIVLRVYCVLYIYMAVP